MTEQDNGNKYITCSRCKMKYQNNDGSIKEQFGFKRLGERLKTCTRCRGTRTGYYKQYSEEHKEQKQEYSKQYYQDHKEQQRQRWREYYNLHKNQIYKQMLCADCGKEVRKTAHPKTSK